MEAHVGAHAASNKVIQKKNNNPGLVAIFQEKEVQISRDTTVLQSEEWSVILSQLRREEKLIKNFSVENFILIPSIGQ